MKNTVFTGSTGLMALLLLAPAASAQSENQGVYWHIDPNVKSCSMVIDPSLTQAQWHTFNEQVGAILSFKSLAPAATLGGGNFIVAVDYGSTPVDQHDPAWINTFTHPDEDCPLGDAIRVPTIRARLGVSDRVDVGGFWTTAPEANYGAVGGEVKYAFLQRSENGPVAAVRASATILTGVPDFNLNTYSADVIVGKRMSMFTPYVGFRENLIIGTETTAKVDLDRETHLRPQGFAGLTCSVGWLDIAAEYNVSTVNTLALAVGAGRHAR